MAPVNGITSWVETHHEVVSEITNEARKDVPRGLVAEAIDRAGTGALYELGEKLADEFEELNEGREWDGEFYDEIERFLNKKLYGDEN